MSAPQTVPQKAFSKPGLSSLWPPSETDIFSLVVKFIHGETLTTEASKGPVESDVQGCSALLCPGGMQGFHTEAYKDLFSLCTGDSKRGTTEPLTGVGE